MHMLSMTLAEVAHAVKGQCCGCARPGEKRITRVITDTRDKTGNVKYASSLFIPLKGERFDGHEFIEEAVALGVGCFLCERPVIHYGIPYILVSSVNEALMALAAYYRSLFHIPVVAVTGSAGKTTTKDLVASVLSTKYKTVKTQGNLNNQFGLPLTIFEWGWDTQAAVLEMGMNSFGEISRLSRIARPDICIITNIGTAHIEHLGSREGILEAKSEIFEYMSAKGCAILNGDDDMLLQLAGKSFLKYFFSIYNHSDKMCVGNHVQYNGIEGASFQMDFQETHYRLTVPRPGQHMVYNAMAAVMAGNLLGVEKEKIELGIRSFMPSKNRMEILNIRNLTILNDVYNANPDSMKAAFQMLKEVDGKNACILGDMLELGEQGPDLHYEVGRAAVESGIDTVICIGDLARYIYDGAHECQKSGALYYYPDKEDFFREYESILFSGGIDTVLIKASRGMAFEDIIEKLTS